MKEIKEYNWISNYARDLTVLIIDDDVSSLIYVSSILQRNSYKVSTSQAVSVALSMVEAQEDRFKLVMANADMPDMDSLAFLHRLLEKDIPVILMSSERSTSAAKKAIAEGASFFLSKPITSDDLKYVWQHVCRKKISSISLYQNAKLKGKQIEVSRTADYSSQKQDESRMKRPNEDEQKLNKSHNKSLQKRPRLIWTKELHLKFTAAFTVLGEEEARPKPILEIMGVPDLTQRHISSHLQKYKDHMKRIHETGSTNLPAVSKSSNFFGMLKGTTPPFWGQSIRHYDLGIMGDHRLQMLNAPSGSWTPGITLSYSSPNKKLVLGTSSGTKQDLGYLAGQFSSGNNEPYTVNFPTNSTGRNQKMELMQVSKTTSPIAPDSEKDWDEEMDLMEILNSGEFPELADLMITFSDWSSEQDVSHPTPMNMSETVITNDKQKTNAAAVSGSGLCSTNQIQQPLLDPADLLNILLEEPADFGGLRSDQEPSPADVDRYCEWLTSVLEGTADNNNDAADFNYGIA